MRLEEIDSGFGFLCHWRDRVRFEDLDWLGIDGSINFFYLAFVWELDGWGREVFLEFNLEMEKEMGKEMEVMMTMITKMMKEKTKLEK